MKLPATYETEVYLGAEGHVVVAQPDPLAAYGADDNIVLLSPEQARLVAHELLRLADDLESDG
ncbi:hypothetical protein N0700_30410 [Pseudomonas aeruginosa]|uniref:hypothetical protein n=1 Tax=Pseudomonas aeruginosa TaxID=287 RepID=UPI0005BAF332|nr:hypothetical protein [Pseudomonas aeruginosa]MBI7501721.1 hypothetical protein [Pseudomonas aeruginosa]MBI8274930.1 hypothetical protein [Pseudomonas aeruginosa]MCM8589436.1 hypothetical protein [Pseudomonas aeruginosa]MCM8673347.1 hypothetical protein [Pseudomonas aeruginosa]MCP2653294.1 hypothetical protein [Pseudomonas aeruginosa]